MSPAQSFEQRKKLREILAGLDDLPRHVWLYIPASITVIAHETPCYATTFNTRDLSPEEQDEFDLQTEREKIRCFFNREQLEDIRANLEAQRPGFPAELLVSAIDFYWKHDAFIDLSMKTQKS